MEINVQEINGGITTEDMHLPWYIVTLREGLWEVMRFEAFRERPSNEWIIYRCFDEHVMRVEEDDPYHAVVMEAIREASA